jgi:hypothetical protein
MEGRADNEGCSNLLLICGQNPKVSIFWGEGVSPRIDKEIERRKKERAEKQTQKREEKSI